MKWLRSDIQDIQRLAANEGEKTAPALKHDRICTKRESSATPTKRVRFNLQREEPATLGSYPEFQQGQIDDKTVQMDLNSSMHPEGEKTAPALQHDRVCTKRESSATPTQKGRSNLQLEELATSGGYPSVPKKERDERVFPSTTDTTGRPRGDQLEPNRSFYSNKLNSILPSFHNQGSLSVFSTNAQSNFSCPCFSAVPEATHKAS